LGIQGEAGDLVVEVRRVGVVLTGRRVVDVQVPVLEEVRVQSDTQQTVLTTGVNLQLQGSVRGERLRVVDLDLAADQFGEEDSAVLGNVHSKGCGGVLVQGDALVHAPVRATTVPVHETGGPLHSAQDVLDEHGLIGEVRAVVAHSGHPGTTAVIGLAPGDRVVVAHHVAAGLVGRFVHRGQHMGFTAHVRRVVVPLVGALPSLREVLGGG